MYFCRYIWHLSLNIYWSTSLHWVFFFLYLTKILGLVRMDMAGVLGSLDVCQGGWGTVKWETNKDALDYGLADTMEFGIWKDQTYFICRQTFYIQTNR